MKSFSKSISVFLAIVMMFSTTTITAFAAPLDKGADSKMIIATPSTSNARASGGGVVSPNWLGAGPITRYPAEGGTWEYGFWESYARSYYTVDLAHGSTVIYNGQTNRSIDTAAGYTSIAEIMAVNLPNSNDSYYYRICE